ncbi:MAG: GNAT family N-acetyltransferase [Caldilineaceae bacterium]
MAYAAVRRPRSNTALIWGVYVRPSWRGRHIAEDMLEVCVGWARENGVSVVKLAVVSTNGGAIRCYLRCGFQVYGVEPQVLFHDGVMQDDLLMARVLANE